MIIRIMYVYYRALLFISIYLYVACWWLCFLIHRIRSLTSYTSYHIHTYIVLFAMGFYSILFYFLSIFYFWHCRVVSLLYLRRMLPLFKRVVFWMGRCSLPVIFRWYPTNSLILLVCSTMCVSILVLVVVVKEMIMAIYTTMVFCVKPNSVRWKLILVI